MQNAVRMNVFRHRAPKTNGEQPSKERRAEKEISFTEDPEGPRFGKGAWIKKLSSCPSSNYKIPCTPVKPRPTMRPFNFTDSSTPRSPTNPDAALDPAMPDLESIIREFETGFLSPTKHDTATDSFKQRNFVKKIVAAFEVKYKTYNDWKTEQETKDVNVHRETGKRSVVPEKLPSPEPKPSLWRRSGIFGSPFKTSQPPQEKTIEDSPGKRELSFRDEPESGCESAGSEASSTPTRSPVNNPVGLGMFSSPFTTGHSASKDPNRRSGIYMTPVNLERQDSGNADLGSFSDASSVFKFDKEESRIGNMSSGYFSGPYSLDDTKSLDDADWDVTLPVPEETILLDSNISLEENQEIPGRCGGSGNRDGTPKIVGAYLKRPIECQDTSIDWIPITGKKLPRKKSLKKIFSLFSGKRALDRKTKLFSSERNLNEEPREPQDSGYEEKSGSSSSLASLISINDILLQQGNTYIEPERRRALRTFRSARFPSRDRGEEDEAFCEVDGSSGAEKKLVLTEVPRDEVKLDLGPSYPASVKLTTMSLDRKSPPKPTISPQTQHVEIPRIPKHPFLSKIPKHPFVSMTKIDSIQETPLQDQSSPETATTNLHQVEFHRSCADFPLEHRSSSEESVYDVPRRFISKSETEISDGNKSARCGRQKREEHDYDIPRAHTLERPRSSVYEEAVSLKRRSEFLRGNSTPDFYASDVEPHYATVKPRNKKMNWSRDMFRSINDLSNIEESSVF